MRMSKQVSDLKEAKANRSSGPHQQRKPRLAERLVALAPLARAPLVAEREHPEPDDGLSRLSHVSRPASSSYQANALVPLQPSQLPLVREPARLSPVSVSPPRFETEHELQKEPGRDLTGFLVGLTIATAIGVVLYLLLA